MTTEQRLDLIVSGKVQGVGFRYSLKLKAESLDIKGYVRNQRDGSVFVAVQGEVEAIEELVKWCYLGPPASVVNRVEKIHRTIEGLSEFSIQY